jgi:hypothetical protein
METKIAKKKPRRYLTRVGHKQSDPADIFFPANDFPDTLFFRMSGSAWWKWMQDNGKVIEPVADLYERDLERAKVLIAKGEDVRKVAHNFGMNYRELLKYRP